MSQNCFWIKTGNNFMATDRDYSKDLHDKLPAGNYVVKFNNMSNQFFLEEIKSFKSPSKVYGDVNSNINRILTTFHDRENGTGVLLTGEKGSGKTLLARELSNVAAQQGIPTLIVNESYKGDIFNIFIQAINQPIIIIFDEFEKVYNEDELQEGILTLLDGMFASKKLFIFTCNEKYRINSFMMNRPGRIFYMLEFEGLSYDFINEYCLEKLNNKKHVEQVCKIGAIIGKFNFDMLKALVEEMNRYNEDVKSALNFLNIKVMETDTKYEVSLEINDEFYDTEHTMHYFDGHPLLAEIFKVLPFELVTDTKSGKIFKRELKEQLFKAEDLIDVNHSKGIYTFENKNGARAYIEQEKIRTFRGLDLL